MRLPILLLGLLTLVSTARAHDRYEAWTNALVYPDRLELVITMALATAVQAVDPEQTLPPLTPENFAAHRARFETAARVFCVLTSGRQPLVLRTVDVALTEENDIAFKLIFPRPAPGRLHFHAAFLKQLGPGYGGILEVSDTWGHHLGWEQLTSENPDYDVTVLSPPPKP